MGKKRRAKKERKPVLETSYKDRQKLPAWVVALIAAVAIFGVVRSIGFEFVYDDLQQILQNTWIRDWANAGRFFTTSIWAFASAAAVSNYYRPLQMVVYTAVYSIAGPNPAAFHLFNILVHALCSILVALIGFRLTRNVRVGAAGGLIFALHPIHAESVAWVAGVTDPLCAVFYFSALYWHVRDGQSGGSRASNLSSSGFFLAALLSKEMAFTFPAVAAWLDWCLYRRLRWSQYTVFAGVFALYSIMRINALHAFFIHQLPAQIDFVTRLLSTIVLVAEYLAKMFVPYGISAFHVFEPTTSIISARFGLSLSVIAAFAALAWMFRRQRELLFLAGFCIVTLLPVLHITGIGENILADRYLYIPTLGSCLILPLAAHHLALTKSPRPRWATVRTGAVLLLVLLTAYAWMLWREVGVWRNPPTLYLETMRRSPEAALIAHNLASYYYDREDLGKAEEWDLRALGSWQRSFVKNRRHLAEIYSGLGGIRFKQGNVQEARDFFTRAYEAAPDYDPILQNIGVFYTGLHEYDRALTFFEATLRVNPRSAFAYSNAAGLSVVLGKPDQGIAYALKALEISPNYGDACVNLGRAYVAKGMKAEARRAFLELKRIDPSRAAMADKELAVLDGSR